MSKTKTVLGGGISGLSAAYYLTKKFPLDKINLIEATSRIGGWIKSTTLDGHLFEQGPRTLRPRGDKGINTLELVEELDLVSEILPLNTKDPAAKNRMIYVNNELHKLPSSFGSLFRKQSPFSKPLIFYIYKEFTTPKISKAEDDESIYNFVKRRFGEEIADYAVSPLICGICAGDAKEISVKFLMEEMYKYEQQYGSVTKGVIYNMFKRNKPKRTSSFLTKCAKKDSWSIYTFKNGLETLPKRLAEANKWMNVDILLNSACAAIEFGDKITVHTNNNKIITDHLIACVPSNVLSKLLRGHPKLSLLLQQIPYVTVGVVNLQYDHNVLNEEAFGFLIPPNQHLPVLGVIYDSCCYPCGDGTVLTVMMGGHWFNDHFGHNPDKDRLADVAITQVCQAMGITQLPNSYSVNVLRDCIPQYRVGHNSIVKDIHDYIKSRKLPLSLSGSAYYGVGVNDAIWCSKKVVEDL